MNLVVTNQGPYVKVTVPLLNNGINLIAGTDENGSGKSSLLSGMHFVSREDRRRGQHHVAVLY